MDRVVTVVGGVWPRMDRVVTVVGGATQPTARFAAAVGTTVAEHVAADSARRLQPPPGQQMLSQLVQGADVMDGPRRLGLGR